MAGSRQLSTAHLEGFRGYLRLLAEAHLDRALRAKCDVSDVVQETLVKAWKGRDGFQGRSEGEICAWLRRILARNLANARRDHLRQKRDLRRERSLRAGLDRSSARLEGWLVSHLPSPSQAAERAEMLERIANALEQLPEPQRRAIASRYWRGRSLDETAHELDRRPGDVAVLVHRGMKRLRQILGGEREGGD